MEKISDLGGGSWLDKLTDLANTGAGVYEKIKGAGKTQKPVAQPVPTPQGESPVKYYIIAGGAALLALGLFAVLLLRGGKKG